MPFRVTERKNFGRTWDERFEPELLAQLRQRYDASQLAQVIAPAHAPWYLRGIGFNGTINSGFSAVWRGQNSRVEAGLKVIKRSSKTAGFNNPAGRARHCAVDPLEPVDAFNISVPRR